MKETTPNCMARKQKLLDPIGKLRMETYMGQTVSDMSEIVSETYMGQMYVRFTFSLFFSLTFP